MSKIIGPWPPSRRSALTFPLEARWWELGLLEQNSGGNFIIFDHDEQWGWASLEFFDGCDTLLDAGLDHPTVHRVIVELSTSPGWASQEFTAHRVIVELSTSPVSLYVLSVEQPTPCPRWKPVTNPGQWKPPTSDVAAGHAGSSASYELFNRIDAQQDWRK